MSRYRVCPHCNESVSTKVYKEHERLYCDKKDRTWITLRQLNDAASIEDDDDYPSPPSTVSIFTGILTYTQYTSRMFIVALMIFIAVMWVIHRVCPQSQRVNSRRSIEIVNRGNSLILICNTIVMKVQWKWLSQEMEAVVVGMMTCKVSPFLSEYGSLRFRYMHALL